MSSREASCPTKPLLYSEARRSDCSLAPCPDVVSTLPIKRIACLRCLLNCDLAFQISFMLFKPWFAFRACSSSILSAFQGWEGVSYFGLENFGSPMIYPSLPLNTHCKSKSSIGLASLSTDLVTTCVSYTSVRFHCPVSLNVVLMREFHGLPG